MTEPVVHVDGVRLPSSLRPVSHFRFDQGLWPVGDEELRVRVGRQTRAPPWRALSRLVLGGSASELQGCASQVLVRGNGIDASALDDFVASEVHDGNTALTPLLPPDQAERRVVADLGFEALRVRALGPEDHFSALMRKRS